MTVTREEFFRNLYYRLIGYDSKRLYKCTQCGGRPWWVQPDIISSEPCGDCEAVAWRELTEEEFVSETDLSDLLRLHSDHLADYLASGLGSLYEADVESSESSEWAKLLGKLVECLEGFGDEQTATWLRLNLETRPKIMAPLLDEFYTRDFLRKARKMVERTMKLTAMTPKATPDPGVNLYLREATRCCVAGFWESSVALSRTTLELALRHRLKEGHGFLPTDDKFETVIEAAYMCRVIDHAHLGMAEEVRKNGNNVVHGSRANEGVAWHVLVCTRGVLDHIYSRS
jgi:hypothetical protein